MKIHSQTRLMLPLLVLLMSCAMAASVQAQDRYDQRSGGTSATLQVNFGSTPHWTNVPGTRVRVIRERERPDYDMFRYGGSYYVYDNDQWYTSRRMRGGFTGMDERNVPRELSRVPREHWRNYPSSWSNPNQDPRRHRDGQRRDGGDTRR